MSWWSYVNGVVEVTPLGRTQAEKRYILETILNHLPRVTGSEGDMEVHIIQLNGHNSSSSCDEYGDQTNNLVDSFGYKSQRRGWLQVQDNYVLMLNGSLRDRTFEETFKEFMKWLCRLSKRTTLRNILVRVYDYEKSYLIDVNGSQMWDSVFYKMFEWPSWCKDSDGEPTWCEHLMWDRMKNCEYPMLLGYKYFADPENDAEVERRFEFLRGDKNG